MSVRLRAPQRSQAPAAAADVTASGTVGPVVGARRLPVGRFLPATLRSFCAALCVLLANVAVAQKAEGTGESAQCPELKDGDRVAWIGDGLVEREQHYGSVESAWLLHWYDRQIRVRNLGWTGDTVRGEARSYFGPPEEGFRRLLQHVELARPSVIVLSYGNNESFAGEAGLEDFLRGYNRLLDELQRHTTRIVIISPIPVEADRSPHPDAHRVNRFRKLYTDAVLQLAERRGLCFVDVFHPLLERMAAEDALTDNGVHLNERGYRVLSELIERGWFGGVRRPSGLTPQLERRLRELVRRKNELFFHQYRPQNETYLRGFRKHEQGQNARELPRFALLIEQTEQQIFALLRAAAAASARQRPDDAASRTPAPPKCD